MVSPARSSYARLSLSTATAANRRASSTTNQKSLTQRRTLRTAFSTRHLARRVPGSQLPCSLQPQVAVHDLTVAARQDGDLEAELPNAVAHFIDDSVIFPRVPDVEDELVDVPNLNLSGLGCRFLQEHIHL